MSEISPVVYFVGLKANDIVIAAKEHLSLSEIPHGRPMKSLVTAVLSPLTAFSENGKNPVVGILVTPQGWYSEDCWFNLHSHHCAKHITSGCSRGIHSVINVVTLALDKSVC